MAQDVWPWTPAFAGVTCRALGKGQDSKRRFIIPVLSDLLHVAPAKAGAQLKALLFFFPSVRRFIRMSGYTYILASKRMGTLYIGVTNDLVRRVWEHKSGIIKGFTSRYKIHHLVWYEFFDSIEDAISCEKMMKEWHRDWKIRAIEEVNPLWNDLYETLNQ